MPSGGAGTPVLAVLALLWALLALRSITEHRRAPRLPVLPPPRPSEPPAVLPPPLVSVLLPARNEAERLLVPCVRSLLAQDYPAFEIIAVDDRSSDATGELLAALAAADARLRVVTGMEPPQCGWVGKQHALMQAAARARGDWLLAVDADAIYDPAVLREAVGRAEALALDALSLLPRAGAGDFWVSVTYPVGMAALLLAAPLSRANRPGTATGLAWGGFFLIRRRVFDAVGGYEGVARETSEDTKLAALLKRRGFRMRAESATHRIFTPMYPTFADLWQGTMKNVYAGPVATPLLALALAALGLTPAFATVGAALARKKAGVGLGLAAWLCQAMTVLPVYRSHDIPAWRALFVPVGVGIATAQMLCTTWRVAVTGQGVPWRGRLLRTRRRSGASPRPPAAPLTPPREGRPRSPR